MKKTVLTLLALLALTGAQAAKKDIGQDAGSDHPLLQRFAGSRLIGYDQQDWAARQLPSASGVAKNADKFERPLQLEGKVTRLFYLAPQGKSPLEVFRNYQQALMGAGFKPVFSCEQDCSKPYFALDGYERGRGMKWTEHSVRSATDNSSYNAEMGLDYSEGRMLSGSLSRNGQTLHVLLYTSTAVSESTKTAATYIEIVEPKAMQTGQVTVDAKALGQGLNSEGKVALYGLYFDTGKSEVRAESDAQLKEMAAALKAQPALKVYIVGHTDNVGALDANLALSQARAQAVVAALGKAGIAPARLAARGVASLAPVGSNADEAGRARNRRVEMVLQ